jgi:hypothetical protein
MIVSRKILSKTLWLVCKNSEETLWNENLLLYGNITKNTTVSTVPVPNFKRKIFERGQIDTTNTQMHD